jgi:hypothetical protein
MNEVFFFGCKAQKGDGWERENCEVTKALTV